MKTYRIGLLGAAKITPMALITPAKQLPFVKIQAVAARDRNRAHRFAKRYAIPDVHNTYEELIADPEIDIIYNPLPNSHHAYWSIKAMEAGKHVLCEKPVSANAAEAQQMYECAQHTQRIVMEAFHWRYHPLAVDTIALLRAQTLGTISHIEASFCIPLPFSKDIRYNPQLAGGALMDVGCYTVSILRHFMGSNPVVEEAKAHCYKEDLDQQMTAILRFPCGAQGKIHASLWGWPPLSAWVRVQGSEGSLSIVNPIGPHLGYHHRIIRKDAQKRTDRFWGTSTYLAQLKHFIRAIEEGISIPTDLQDGIENMRVLDAIYTASGLPLRRGILDS